MVAMASSNANGVTMGQMESRLEKWKALRRPSNHSYASYLSQALTQCRERGLELTKDSHDQHGDYCRLRRSLPQLYYECLVYIQEKGRFGTQGKAAEEWAVMDED